MRKHTINQKKDRVPRPLEVIDWLEQNRVTKKLCLYCGNNEPKPQQQYCSKECERHDSVWHLN